MNHFEMAKDHVKNAEAVNDFGYDHAAITAYATLAIAHAAIAQVEQLERIADLLERQPASTSTVTTALDTLKQLLG